MGNVYWAESGESVLIVIATENELALVDKCDQDRCIITGVGALNVIHALMDVDRNEPILNVGYVGSNCIPVGTKVRVGSSQLYHPNADFESPVYDLCGDVPCFTSNDFVTKTSIEEPCVFDMELAYILAMGFKNVSSDKTVSDNLDLNEYTSYIGR